MRYFRTSTTQFGFTRLYSSHEKLIKTMSRLGYPINNGLCHGVACVAAQYHLSNDMVSFCKQIEFTKKGAVFSDKKPEKTREFFDDITIGQSPETHPIIHDTASEKCLIQNSTSALAAIKNKRIEKHGGIKRATYFTGAYTTTELCRYFEILKKSAVTHACQFALLIGSPDHAIMIGFDAAKKSWVFVDANHLSKSSLQYKDSYHLALQTSRSLSFSKSGNAIFSTELLTTASAENKAKKIIDEIKQDPVWEKLHRVNYKKAKMIDRHGHTWLMSACTIENEIDVAQSLINHGANLEHVNQLGLSSLDYAIFYQNRRAIKLLLENGMDANHPENQYLYFAVEAGLYDVTKDLLSHGAKVNIGHPSPVYIAAQNNNEKLLQLFKQHGIVSAGSSFNRFFSRKTSDALKPAAKQNYRYI